MTASWWLELAGLLTGGGGAVQLIVKLTRLAVAVEQLVEGHKAISAMVADHEERLKKYGL